MAFTIDNGAWILVADGGKALFLENMGDSDYLNLRVVEDRRHENPPTREQGSDKPGRYDDVGVGRSAVANTDWHEFEKERFAHEVAGILRKAALEKRFKQLVLIAPPKALGNLRDNLDKETRDLVIGELDKDLTNHEVGEIEKHLMK